MIVGRTFVAGLLFRLVFRPVNPIQQLFVKTVQKFTGASLSTATSEPKETRVGFHVVAKRTIAPVTPIVKHVATDWGLRQGGINNVLGEIKVRIGHETRRRSCFLREILVHGKENLDTRIQLLLEINIVGAAGAFVNRANRCRHGCAGIGRPPRSRYCFFAFYTILSGSRRSEKCRG